MAFADAPLSDLLQSDLEGLVSSGVSESARIEYKRDTYGGADADKKEFLKDITSLANAFGGQLLIGIDESGGAAIALSPLTLDPDAEILRLESLARDGIEPRINGLQVRAVPVNGGHVIVVRVPRSWNAPHRVSFKGTSRFYSRTSAGAYELSVEELRAKFNASANSVDRAMMFRQLRSAMLSSDEGIFPLAKNNGQLVIHIYPLATTGEAVVDLTRALELSDRLSPVAVSSWSTEFNFDGLATVRSGEEVYGYTQLFRDGAIEATKVRVVADSQGVRRIPALDFGGPIMKSVPNYLSVLRDLGVQPPFAVMITVSGVRGAYLGYSQSQWLDDPAIIRRDVLELPLVVIADYGSTAQYQAALRPAFDALWNAGGLSGCTYFSPEGVWQPHN